ncbi:hypothetical protein [Novosphingobium sp.]|uniref:hypothetical protein n=1 Tax=Novosphingobium sp. TaxID=1874826 RepID=UPI0035B46358
MSALVAIIAAGIFDFAFLSSVIGLVKDLRSGVSTGHGQLREVRRDSEPRLYWSRISVVVFTTVIVGILAVVMTVRAFGLLQ